MYDLDIKKEVKEALDWEPALDSRAIDMSVKDGIVTLTGTVQSWLEREEAERATWASPGVGDVENELMVNPVSVYQVR